MSQPFLAEIRIVGFNFPPKGWAFCNGQVMPIQQNTALFSLIGTFYGGNGTTIFALPNLQGRAPVHQGQGPGLIDYSLGQTEGTTTATVNTTQMPGHPHPVLADSAAAGQTTPVANTWGKVAGRTPPPFYQNGSLNTAMNAGALLPAGGSQPHNNLSPLLVLNFIIAMQGIFPARN